MFSMRGAAKYGIYAVGLSGRKRDGCKRKCRFVVHGNKRYYGIYAVAYELAFRDASHGESNHFNFPCWEDQESHFV